MEYQTEVKTAKLDVGQWISQYCCPGKYAKACEGCPDYGRVWSCPPNVPSAKEYLGSYRNVIIAGIKVCYGEEFRAGAFDAEKTQWLREISYGKVKRQLMETLLCIESAAGDAKVIGAGRCEFCKFCARPEGKPCRHPEKCRYSFSAMEFDLGRMTREVLGFQLLWTPSGLPAYDIAVAALVYGKK